MQAIKRRGAIAWEDPLFKEFNKKILGGNRRGDAAEAERLGDELRSVVTNLQAKAMAALSAPGLTAKSPI